MKTNDVSSAFNKTESKFIAGKHCHYREWYVSHRGLAENPVKGSKSYPLLFPLPSETPCSPFHADKISDNDMHIIQGLQADGLVRREDLDSPLAHPLYVQGLTKIDHNYCSALAVFNDCGPFCAVYPS